MDFNDNDVYNYAYRLKELGKSKGEVVAELNMLGVDPQSISSIVSRLYDVPSSYYSQEEKEDQGDDKKNKGYKKEIYSYGSENKFSFIKSLFYFNAVFLLIAFGVIYSVNRLVGVSVWSKMIHTPYILLFNLFVVFLISSVAALRKRYWSSILYSLLSLFIFFGGIFILFYIEIPFSFKSLVLKQLLLMSKELNTSGILEMLIADLLVFSILILLLKYVYNKININSTGDQFLKKTFIFTSIIVALVFVSVFVYVNILFKEEVKVEPIRFHLSACDEYSLGIYSPAIAKFCKWRLSQEEYYLHDFRFNSVKEKLSQNSINLRNKKERDMYLASMRAYAQTSSLGYHLYLFLEYLFSNTYINNSNILRDLSSSCSMDALAIDRSFSKIYDFNSHSLLPEEVVTPFLTDKYFLEQANKLLDCFNEHKGELYLLSPNGSIISLKEAQDNDFYWKRGRVLKDKDLSLIKSIVEGVTLMDERALNNCEAIFGKDKVSEIDNRIINELKEFHNNECGINISDIDVYMPDELHFFLTYPIKCDKYFELSNFSDLDIFINGDHVNVNSKEESGDHPEVECVNQYKKEKRKIECLVSNVPVDMYNIIKIRKFLMNIEFIPLQKKSSYPTSRVQ